MRESIKKSVIITALYHYLMNADAEEQVHCLNLFGCEPHKSITLKTDADKRATLFENVINDCVRELDDE